MYDGAVANVRTCGGITSDFSITIGLHQGSALSPFLFALVMDELTRAIQDEIPWCMLFADDIVLVDGQEIPMCSHFKYLGSIIQKDEEINSDVNYRIQADWLKWRSATRVLVLCDHNIPLRLKRSFIVLLLGWLCYMIRNAGL